MTGIIRLSIVTIIAAAAAWLAGSCLNAPTVCAAEKRLLWQSREQFVALEPRDGDAADPAQQNGHPARVTAEQLSTLLAALQFRPEKNAPAEPLFTAQTLETLAPQLVLGLQKAATGEDLTFAVIGLHKALLGLAKEPRVTTGRLFVRDGQLNLIVGLAQRDVNEREDRRLAPFTPGSRQTPAPGEWRLEPPSAPPGIVLVRRDWIALPIDWKPAATPTHAPQEPIPAATAGTPAPSAVHPAERLTVLKELREKGLISEDEYQNKRREILQGL